MHIRSFSSAKLIEAKWKEFWKLNPIIQNDKSKTKYYALSMFPYPSGFLHMGHVRVYTISDCIARCKRMQGFNVMHPMGWDAFGLPAENAAIERKISPKAWTMQNINHMKSQLDLLSIQFDYDREVTTCNPDYYKWTQWLFLQLYQKGYAYRAEGLVNWDPIDETVLANEQVDPNGKSWRSGALVEKKALLQWYFRITSFASELLNGLDKLEWPLQVKEMQKNWIGQMPGWEIDFPVLSVYSNQLANFNIFDGSVKIFTKRPECIFGVTFLAISSKLINLPNETQIGLAKNPLTDEEIPVFAASFVDPEIGTGAVMGVPSNSEDDKTFSTLNNLPEKQIFDQNDNLILQDPKYATWHGLSSKQARIQISQYLEEKGIARKLMTYRLRDWLVSRQRYWGAPIPIIHCKHCGTVPVPENDLPVLLPENIEFTGKKASPLSHCNEWKIVKCPKCNGVAERETDTLDTFVDSSWYFLRYTDSNNSQRIFDERNANYWSPVDVYVGGIEHAILHLLYSRFITHFLHSEKYLDNPEPFTRLITQGMVHGKTLKCPESGKYLKPEELEYNSDNKCIVKKSQLEPIVSFEKMSKSKYNGIDPQEIISKFGADTVRVYTLFKAPPDLVLDWNELDIIGSQRWLQRVSKLVKEYTEYPKTEKNSANDKEIVAETQKFILTITSDLDEKYHKFNTAVSSLMKFTNDLSSYSHKETSQYFPISLKYLLTLMSPIAPHYAAELFNTLQQKETGLNVTFDIRLEKWPVCEKQHDETEEKSIAVQINGKIKKTVKICINHQTSDEEFKEVLLNHPDVVDLLSDLKFSKVMFKKHRFINFCTQ